MKKQIKIIIMASVIFVTILALIIPKARYYLREGDVITIGINMEKVEHSLESFYKESYGRYPQSLEERTKETDKKFLDFLSREDWYEPPVFPMGRDWFKPKKERTINVRDKWCKPIRRKMFHKVIKFKPLTDTITGRISPCKISIFTDGVRYKIAGGDKNGFLVPEGTSPERGTSNPKIIYSDNYWENE